MADLTRIDPEKLLQLARERQGPGGVTLGWPTVLKIIDELRQLQREVGYLQELERNVPPCRFHNRDFEACIAYCSKVPCEPRPDEVGVQAAVGAEGDQ